MNPIVVEWMAKADGDHAAARLVFDAEAPNFDAACYHAQQAAEKLMKAVLIAHDAPTPRTHNLMILADLLRTVDASWACPPADLRMLSLAATLFRYPGASATREDAAETIAAFERIHPRLLALLRR